MAQYLLGIDNGNTVCKATLFDEGGRVLHSVAARVNTHYPKTGWSERDMTALWQTNATTIRRLIRGSGAKPTDIAAVGGTGHGNGLYLLDQSGQPLRGIQSLDSRAGDIVERWNADGLSSEVFPLTGQEFWASQTNSLLAWVKKHEPDRYREIGSLLLCKDYINYRLTGKIATDYTDISATNLLNIHTRAYDDTLLNYFGLADIRPALPPIFHSHQIIGDVTKAAAAETGLAAGTPVVAGMLDADASLIGGGTVENGQMGIVAGTWSVNGRVSRQPPTDPNLAMTALFAVPDHYLVIEASATSLTNLDWFIDQFCEEESREATRRDVSKYQFCDRLAGSVSTASALLFHPFLHGSNAHTNARAGFYGLAGRHTKADMLRAVYEGIVFGHRTHIDKLRKSENNCGAIRLTGGGARSPLLGQLFADVLDTRIEIPQAEETGTSGAAIAAGVGVGLFQDYKEAVEKTVHVGKTYSPNSHSVALYQEKYRLYFDLIQLLKPIWNQLNQIQS